MKFGFKQSALTTFFVTTCFCLTLFAFPIFHSYIKNPSHFQSYLSEVLVHAFLLTVLLSVFCGAILSLIRTSIYSKFIALMVALSFLFWLQGSVMVWKYGPLDGRPIPWSSLWINGAIDTSIWLFVIFLAIRKTFFINKHARTITQALIVIQLVSAIAIFAQTPRNFYTSRPFMFDEAVKFEFSKEKNVIVIVLDEFQSNIYQEIIDSDDQYGNMLDGFVYFRNALAPFSYTELSVPAFLTGELYDNSEQRRTYLKDSFLDGSILKSMKENGFDVDLFPLKGWEYHAMYFDHSICSNLKKRTSSFKIQLAETLLLFDISLFRHLPHFSKKYIYCNNQWLFYRWLPAFHKRLKKQFISPDKGVADVESPARKLKGDAFIDSAKSEFHLQSEGYAFKFYHLWGLHIPLEMNKNSEISDQVEYNKENYTRQAKAYLEIMQTFFNFLKLKGVYDNSVIFVIGDHGSGRSKDMYINPVSDHHNDTLNQVSPEGNFQMYKARGIPLVLAKPFQSTDAFKISDAPISLVDIPKTIVTELNLKADFPGLSMFEIEDDFKRTRYYGAFRWFKANVDFVEPITMYEIKGHSWRNESWQMQSILPPPPKE